MGDYATELRAFAAVMVVILVALGCAVQEHYANLPAQEPIQIQQEAPPKKTYRADDNQQEWQTVSLEITHTGTILKFQRLKVDLSTARYTFFYRFASYSAEDGELLSVIPVPSVH